MTMRQNGCERATARPHACFMIFDDHVDVLAVIGPNEHIDRTITPDAARALWNELRQRGWYQASETRAQSPSDVASQAASHRVWLEIDISRTGVSIRPLLFSAEPKIAAVRPKSARFMSSA